MPTDATQQEREAYAAFVEQYTGRDMAYHERNGTTSLDFGLAAFLAGRASLPNSGEAIKALVTEAFFEGFASPETLDNERLNSPEGAWSEVEKYFDGKIAALSAKEPK